MSLKTFATMGLACLGLLGAEMAGALDPAELPEPGDKAGRTMQQTHERIQTQEQVRQREQARQRLEQRLNSEQDAVDSAAGRGDGFQQRPGPTRFGQGYESRRGGGNHGGYGGSGGRQ